MHHSDQLARRFLVTVSFTSYARICYAHVRPQLGSRIALELAIGKSTLSQERNFGDLRHVPLTENPIGPDFAPPGGEDWRMSLAHRTCVRPNLEQALERERYVGARHWFRLPCPPV
jgi:hypothetical protein